MIQLHYKKKMPRNMRKRLDRLKKVALGLSRHFGTTVLVQYDRAGVSAGNTKIDFNQWPCFESAELTTGHLYCLN